MSGTRIPSPARSQKLHITPRRYRKRGPRSVGSPARPMTSGRLSSLVTKAQDEQDSFILSPINSRLSVLSNNTFVDQPKRKSWWRKLDEYTQDEMAAVHNTKATHNLQNDLIDIEVLSQDKQDFTIDLPDSSDSESIHSIVIPTRKLFNQKENNPQIKYDQLLSTQESLNNHDKTNIDKTINVPVKNLFNRESKKQNRPTFPAALLAISPNKTMNKTKDAPVEVQGQARNLFGNKNAQKRKNIFNNFVLSESEDEIPEIQAKVFRFAKNPNRRESTNSCNLTIDDWQHLPSSTMVDHQLEINDQEPDMIRQQEVVNSEQQIACDEIQHIEKQANKGVSKKNNSIVQEYSHLPETISNNVERIELCLNRKTDINLVDSNFAVNFNSKSVLEHTDKVPSDGNYEMSIDNIVGTDNIPIIVATKDKNVQVADILKENEKLEDKIEQNSTNESNKANKIGIDVQVKNKSTVVKSPEFENGVKITASVSGDEVRDKENEVLDNNDVRAYIENTGLNANSQIDANIDTQIQSMNVAVQENIVISDNYVETQAQESENNAVDNELVKDCHVDIGDQESDDKEDKDDKLPTYNNIITQDLEPGRDAKDKDHNIVNGNDIECQTPEPEDDEEDRKIKDVVSRAKESNSNAEIEGEGQVDDNGIEIQAQDYGGAEDENNQIISDNVETWTENLHILDYAKDAGDNYGTRTNDSDSDRKGVQLICDHDIESEKKISKVLGDDVEDDKQKAEESNASEEIDSDNQIDDNDIEAQGQDPDGGADDEDDEIIHEDDDIVDNDFVEDAGDNVRTGTDDSESDTEVAGDMHNSDISQTGLLNSGTEASDNEEELRMEETDEDAEDAGEQCQDVERNQCNSESEEEKLRMEEDDEDAEDSGEQSQEVLEVEHILRNSEHEPNNISYMQGNANNDSDKQKSKNEDMNDPFADRRQNTSIRNSKNIHRNMENSLPLRNSSGVSDGTNSSTGSGWDSHRITRKTLRLTLGKDFTPRKSLRALVMEKSAKRQTAINEGVDKYPTTIRSPQASSTKFVESMFVAHETDESQDSDHEMSIQMTQEMLEKVKKLNAERRLKCAEIVKNYSQSPKQKFDDFLFKMPTNQVKRRKAVNLLEQALPKVKGGTNSKPLIPAEMLEDLKYKPPKRYKPCSAGWVTKRLYKYLEAKLEPRYDYKARVRAEKLVETLFQFTHAIRRLEAAPPALVEQLKREMARLDVTKRHFDFYLFFENYMPREIRYKVIPDLENGLDFPDDLMYCNILDDNNLEG